jgi:hypothetical protein
MAEINFQAHQSFVGAGSYVPYVNSWLHMTAPFQKVFTYFDSRCLPIGFKDFWPS